jgi:hypothetical protein
VKFKAVQRDVVQENWVVEVLEYISMGVDVNVDEALIAG